MPNTIHKTRVDALRQAYDTGLSMRSAVVKCGIAKGTVERYYRRWKSQDFGGEMTAVVTGPTKAKWKQEADARRMSVRELHSFVLETIAEDALFNAVLE